MLKKCLRNEKKALYRRDREISVKIVAKIKHAKFDNASSIAQVSQQQNL